MRPRESPHSLDQYVNSQLPYIVRAAICTQPIVPQICKPPAAATRQNMPQQGQLSLGGTGQEFVGSFPISAALLPLSIHGPSIHSFIHSFSPPENTSQMRACACLPVAPSAVAAPRGGAAATQPSRLDFGDWRHHGRQNYLTLRKKGNPHVSDR